MYEVLIINVWREESFVNDWNVIKYLISVNMSMVINLYIDCYLYVVGDTTGKVL